MVDTSDHCSGFNLWGCLPFWPVFPHLFESLNQFMRTLLSGISLQLIEIKPLKKKKSITVSLKPRKLKY